MFFVDIIVCAALDLALYALIDAPIKILLAKCRSDSQRRGVWALEAGMLSLVCQVVEALHHTPWLLFLSTIFTLTWTLTFTNIRQWTGQILTRWNEFEEHEESLEQYKTRQSPPPPPNVCAPQTPMPFSPPLPQVAHDSQQQQQQNWVRFRGPPNVAVSPGMVPQPYSYSVPQRGDSPPRPGYSAGFTPPRPPMDVSFPRNPDGVVTLNTPSSSQTTAASMSSNPNEDLAGGKKAPLLSMFSRFASPQRSDNTTGSTAQQQEVLIKSVIHCLSHTPCLVQGLIGEKNFVSQQHTPESELMVMTADLLDSFRQRLCVRPSLLERLTQQFTQCPRIGQEYLSRQLEMAQFIMAYLTVLHRTVCRNQCGSGIGGSHNGTVPQRFRPLSLKYVYGHLTPQVMKDLKQACRKEIEQGNAFDGSSYAESVQRLCDLEWLTYKEENCSVVDDLFTGQLVESSHCSACRRMSVQTHTFNVLQLPIAQPQHLCASVHLHDCFTGFVSVEDLCGANGLQCNICNRQTVRSGDIKHSAQDLSFSTGSGTPVRANGSFGERLGPQTSSPQRPSDSPTGRSLGSFLSAVVSPIKAPPDDSGYYDNTFKTSTPVARKPVKLTNGQRRTLLRQLPECLIIQLQRVTVQQGHPHKSHQAVTIPMSNLDLTSHVIDSVMRREDVSTPVNTYRLYALAVSDENAVPGKYTTYALSTFNIWYKYDGSVASPVNMEYELTTRKVQENVSMLFYHKYPQ